MYAIVNIKTNKFLYGSDYRYFPPHQRTSTRQMLTYADEEDAYRDLIHRRCGKDYRICVLKTIEIKRIIERENENAD